LIRHVGRDRLEDDAERAGLLERLRISNDLLGRFVTATLNLETAERMHALGREADMTDDGNARADDAMDVLGEGLTALELHALELAFLQHLAGTLDGLNRRRLVAHERHVADDVRSSNAASHCSAVVANLVERHRDRVREALNDHSERVADE